MAIVGQNQAIIWFQENGPGTSFTPFGVGAKDLGGMTGITVPGAGRTPVYGRDAFGNPIVIRINREAPGDLPTATVQVYEQGQVDLLLEAQQNGCPINIQRRFVNCGRLNNPNGWDALDHFSGGEITSWNLGDAPSLEFNDESITNEASVSFSHYIRLVVTSLSALTTTEVQDLLSIAGIPDEDCNRCGNGYPGADQIMVIGAVADAAATGEIVLSVNGGGTWTITTADPFPTIGGVFFDNSDIDVKVINKTQYRVVVTTNITEPATKAQYAYTDVTFGATDITAWTTSSIAATAVADIITAMKWTSYDRLYIAADATGTDIYVSEDQLTTDPGAAIYTGGTVINGFATNYNEDKVFAFGASDLILRELDQNGIFETRVGPGNVAAFTAMTIAGDGTIYAGNGTSIFKSTDDANIAGNWTELKDFTADHSVVAIQCVGGARALGGDAELLRVVVDNSAGGNGEVWESVDGGANFNEVTEVTNLGYNSAYFSQVKDNDNIVIVGDAQGGFGLIHTLSPA